MVVLALRAAETAQISPSTPGTAVLALPLSATIYRECSTA